MEDTISREKAIDSIEKHLRFGDELYPLTDTDKVLNHAFEIAASCVYNLPSAQPEIIRCKDCKHHGTNGYRLNCAVFCCTMPDDGFCSCGERREDG